MTKANSKSLGFTIVELLVVIVVIGILAAITVVSYTGISQKAIAVSLQSDLNGASKKLKMYQIEYSAFPDSVSLINSEYCPPNGKYCFRASSGNVFDTTAYGLSVNNNAKPQTFSLTATKGTVSYVITHSSSPSVVSAVSATGGTITYTDSGGLNPRSSPAYAGGYTVHTFTISGTLSVTGTINGADVLIVGGGGGGGYDAGGGGGGGQAISTNANLSGAMTATVAIAANGGNSGHPNGYTGNPSIFNSNTAIGGGYGGGAGGVGGNGACGGGGGGWHGSVDVQGGIGSPGYNGGNAHGNMTEAGGGGGMGYFGMSGSDADGGGQGGNGVLSNISGTDQYYSAGGKGAAAFTHIHQLGEGNKGTGGFGNYSTNAPEPGFPGVIIIRYRTP